jgi:hypothetical protein
VSADVVGVVDPSGKPYRAKDIRNATPVATAGGYRFAIGDPYSDNLPALEPTMRKRVSGAYSGGQ